MLGELLNRGSGSPALDSLAIIGAAIAIWPLIALVCSCSDLAARPCSEGVKG